MIPKIIHFCWFGGNKYPEVVEKCMQSWKKYCPDYEIKRWDEHNFDITQCNYVYQAYEAKKWAFVSDYARLKILFENGGVYLDTDVELLRNLDTLLDNKAFMGFEHGLGVNSGLIAGCEGKMKSFGQLLEIYEKTQFKTSKGYNFKTCVEFTTEFLISKGLIQKDSFQIVDGVAIYPIEFFCPKNQFTNKINITNNTYTFHRYIGTWADETVKYGQKLKKHCVDKHGKIIGKGVFLIKYSIYVLRKKGIKELIKKIERKISVMLKYR